jgi:F-type H+-transporting ATPase subunit epsilon
MATALTTKTFHVEVITPERVRYQGNAHMLLVNGVEGQMGILPDHAPILALLAPGPLKVQTPDSGEVLLVVGQGFVKMAQNRAVCLVDFAERPEEIDVNAAQKRRTAIQAELAAATTPQQRDNLRMRLKAELARIDYSTRKA